MTPNEHIDQLIAATPDWRGAAPAHARGLILEADPDVVEQWKYMGAPAWDLDDPLIVGSIFKNEVELGFMYGATLPDPQGLLDGELKGDQRRSYELFDSDILDETAFQDLVRAAISRNRSTWSLKGRSVSGGGSSSPAQHEAGDESGDERPEGGAHSGDREA